MHMKAAQELLAAPCVGNYLTPANLIQVVGGAQKTRMSFEIVAPNLFFRESKVFVNVQNNEGDYFQLFDMNEPLISQMIHLKPFLVPENFEFFQAWIREVSNYAHDPQGRKILFGGSDNAELWFGQKNLAFIDFQDPIPGIVRTMEDANAGMNFD